LDIEYRQHGRKWLAEVWADDMVPPDKSTPYSEAEYQEINQWCIDTLKYHARTAYHVFEFKSKRDLDWFLLRWT